LSSGSEKFLDRNAHATITAAVNIAKYPDFNTRRSDSAPDSSTCESDFPHGSMRNPDHFQASIPHFTAPEGALGQ